MHGHGERPYLCEYQDCDRSAPGKGFPRRWNLYDHMKRVHEYEGPTSNGRTSPPLSDDAVTKRGSRRRPSNASQASSAKRVTKPSKPTANSKRRPALRKDTQSQPAILRQSIDYAQPQATINPEQLGIHFNPQVGFQEAWQ